MLLLTNNINSGYNITIVIFTERNQLLWINVQGKQGKNMHVFTHETFKQS